MKSPISILHLPTPSPQRTRPRRTPQLSFSIQMEHFCALGLTFFPKIFMGRNIPIRSTLHLTQIHAGAERTRAVSQLEGPREYTSWQKGTSKARWLWSFPNILRCHQRHHKTFCSMGTRRAIQQALWYKHISYVCFSTSKYFTRKVSYLQEGLPHGKRGGISFSK